jgi:hypothetical protein
MKANYAIPPLRDLPDDRLAARKQHLLAEVSTTPAQNPAGLRVSIARSSARRLAFLFPLGTTAAITIALLVLAWPFASGPSVLAQAVAAIGNGPVTHVVMDYRIGDSLVNLRTGAKRPIHGRQEFWFDPKRGLLDVLTFGGRPVATFLLRPNAQALRGDWLNAFVSGYKAALKAGDYHVTGSGVVAGTPVYWIESKPAYVLSDVTTNGRSESGKLHKRVAQIAIAKSSYKPVYTRLKQDGRIVHGYASHILKLETIAPQPALFARTHLSPMFRAGVTPSSPKTTIPAAQATMKRQALIPSHVIAGVRRSWVGEPPYLSDGNSYKDQLAGVTLYYGRLDPYAYGPPHKAPYISITEFPRPNVYVRAQGLGYYPADGHAVLEGSTATLKVDGLYAIIGASSPRLAIAGARALVNR